MGGQHSTAGISGLFSRVVENSNSNRRVTVLTLSDSVAIHLLQKVINL